MAKSTDVGGGSGAPEPAVCHYLMLDSMNKSSARICTFLARLSRPRVGSYSYTRRSGTGTVTQHKFSCLLLGAPEQLDATGTSCYCMGICKGSEDQVKAMGEKYKEGTAVKLSKVTFDGSVNAQYIHTPLQIVVDMGKTTIHIMSPPELLLSGLQLGSEVVPPRTVAETSSIRSSKSTDVLAMLKSISESRKCKSGEDVADAILIDGSSNASQHAGISVAIFGRQKIEFLKRNAKESLVFLNLVIKVNNGSKEIMHWPGDEVFLAPVCAKAVQLNTDAEAMRDAAVQILTSEWQPTYTRRDVSGTQPLSCCGFLDFASELPRAEHMPEVMQVNWAKFDEPMSGMHILDKSGERIWFLAKMFDVTGSVQVGVPERAALALANTTDKDEFVKMHKAGQLKFALFHNARLTRTTKGTSAAEPGENTDASQDTLRSQSNAAGYVSHTLEEVSVASWSGEDAPNAAYMDVVKILSQCPRHDEALCFAALAEVQSSPHYPFEVAFKDGLVRGSALVALVGSKEKSVVQKCGEGYKVTTKNIVDVLGDALGLSGAGAWDAVAYCGLDDLLEFKLDPPRGSAMRTAVATIIGVEQTETSRSVILEKVQYIDAAELSDTTKTCMKLRTLTRHIKGAPEELESNKRHALPVMMTPSPRKLKSCRTIKRSPTATSLPSPSRDEEDDTGK